MRKQCARCAGLAGDSRNRANSPCYLAIRQASKSPLLYAEIAEIAEIAGFAGFAKFAKFAKFVKFVKFI